MTNIQDTKHTKLTKDPKEGFTKLAGLKPMVTYSITQALRPGLFIDPSLAFSPAIRKTKDTKEGLAKLAGLKPMVTYLNTLASRPGYSSILIGL